MFYFMAEQSDTEEVIRRPWPAINSDASSLEDDSWEILNENNSQDVINRHWFKQNYIDQRRYEGGDETYH